MKHEFTSAEFRKALASGDITIPRKGKGKAKQPAGAAIGHLMEQMEPAQVIVKPREKKPAKPEAPQLWKIKTQLTTAGIAFVPEFRFHPVRKFRFDIAIPESMIAIEYEGIFSDKSGHTTHSGYMKDCEKYNLAAVNGWRVLRYHAKNYDEAIRDVAQLMPLLSHDISK